MMIFKIFFALGNLKLNWGAKVMQGAKVIVRGAKVCPLIFFNFFISILIVTYFITYYYLLLLKGAKGKDK